MDFREPWNFKSLRQVSESHPRSVFEAFNLRRLNGANFINISVSLTKIFFFLKISIQIWPEGSNFKLVVSTIWHHQVIDSIDSWDNPKSAVSRSWKVLTF